MSTNILPMLIPSSPFGRRVQTSWQSTAVRSSDQLQQPVMQSRVRIYAPSAADPRATGLRNSCALLADGFHDLEQSIQRYVKELPSPDDADESSDVEQFLQWLAQRDDASEEQRDFITCQRARLSVDFMVLRRQLSHARFQSLWRRSALSLEQIERKPEMRIHLNPIRVLATLETEALLDDCIALPATVMFFPAGDDIHTIVADDLILGILRALARGPLPVAQLARQMKLSRAETTEIVTELTRLGATAC